MTDNHTARAKELSEHVQSSSNTQECPLSVREDERLDCPTGDAEKAADHSAQGRLGGFVTLPPSIHQEKEEELDVCRVCHCAETDRGGEAALKFLGISRPLHGNYKKRAHVCVSDCSQRSEKGAADGQLDGDSKCVNATSRSDLEAGPCSCGVGSLIELGCACKNDLALAHYACALRWFVSRGSILCEICGKPAVNVSLVDQNKVIAALKERDALQALNSFTTSGETPILDSHESRTDVNIVTDGTPANREQLLDVASWFDPHGNAMASLQDNNTEQIVNIPTEDLLSSVSPATKCAVEGTGILIATGLLTVTIMWLLAPRVGKGVAKKILNVLLGGLCAISIVVFLRFGVLPRIKYGPARYWAILLVFWFLVFGVWASSTRNARSSG